MGFARCRPEDSSEAPNEWFRGEEEEKVSDPKRYKARLTAREFTQRAGISYFETYALVC